MNWTQGGKIRAEIAGVWWFAMENGPFIDDLRVKHGDCYVKLPEVVHGAGDFWWHTSGHLSANGRFIHWVCRFIPHEYEKSLKVDAADMMLHDAVREWILKGAALRWAVAKPYGGRMFPEVIRSALQLTMIEDFLRFDLLILFGHIWSP